MTMKCKKCDSDNIQSLSVIYESGTQKINTTSRTSGGGVGFGGGGLGAGLGAGRTKTSGTQQSHLAEKAAPPKKKSFAASVIIILIGVVAAYFELPIIILLLAITIGGFLGYRAWKYNKEEFPPKYQTWLNSWHCNKCGTIFSVH